MIHEMYTRHSRHPCRPPAVLVGNTSLLTYRLSRSIVCPQLKGQTMAHFIITYRIKHDDTYQTRYDSFIKKLKDISGQTFWNETSSFYAIQACASAKEICRDLCADTGFECATDAVVVIDTSNGLMATSGAIRDRDTLEQCTGMQPR